MSKNNGFSSFWKWIFLLLIFSRNQIIFFLILIVLLIKYAIYYENKEYEKYKKSLNNSNEIKNSNVSLNNNISSTNIPPITKINNSINEVSNSLEKHVYTNEKITETLSYYEKCGTLDRIEMLEKIHVLTDMMRSMIEKIEDEKLKNDITTICNTAKKIESKLKKDKKRIKESTQFINYYFPITLKVLIQYDEIENLHIETDSTSEFMNTVEEKINLISNAFQKHLESLYEKDLTSTTADLDVLEVMLKTDGYTDDDDFNLNKKNRG